MKKTKLEKNIRNILKKENISVNDGIIDKMMTTIRKYTGYDYISKDDIDTVDLCSKCGYIFTEYDLATKRCPRCGKLQE